ncbi:MAG: EamA family transporter [Paraglaciecola sp.]|uniref:EamA family transporter n=1 Tax=Paraglaciecola sp. TaxID=1920173 RepID=UPI003297FB09
MTPKDLLLAVFIIVVWGVNFVVIAWGLEGMPPLLMGGLRFLLVASVGSLFFKRPNTPIKWWFAYALPISFLQFAFLFSALAFGMPAGLASLVLQSQALFTLIFASFLLHENIKSHQILALVIAALGLSLIAISQDNQNMTAIGFALTLAGAAGWALGNISARKISQKGYTSNVNLVIWSAWIPPIPFFIFSYFFEGPEVIYQTLTNFSMQSWWALVYLAAVATIMGYGLWGYLLGRYPAAQIAPLTLGVPLVGLTAASILLSEEITTPQWLGITLVLLGLLTNIFGLKLKKLLNAKRKIVKEH